ncbi:MAG: hypothetical protein JXA66_04415 [Oligoflexia bacterium]|nr:hypothetical protein [Oligoflexia bacterium]
MIKKVILFCSVFCVYSLGAKTLARVGNREITDTDLEQFKKGTRNVSSLAGQYDDKHFMDILINYELALYDAKKKGLDQTSEGRQAMEKGLYNYYIYKMVDSKYSGSEFSTSELKKFYKSDPLLKLNRLCIPFEVKNAKSFKEANSKLSILRSELKSRKISFQQAVSEVGLHNLSHLNGTFDTVFLGILLPGEAATVSKMKQGEVSPVIKLDGYVEIIQLVKIYPFNSIPLAEHNTRMKIHNLETTRDKLNQSLRNRYKSLVTVYE